MKAIYFRTSNALVTPKSKNTGIMKCAENAMQMGKARAIMEYMVPYTYMSEGMPNREMEDMKLRDKKKDLRKLIWVGL